MPLQRNEPGEALKTAPDASQEHSLLGRAVRIVEVGPRYFYRSALVSLAATCLLVIPIAVDVRPPGPLPPPQQVMIAAALAGLCLVVLLALAGLVWPPGRRGPGLDHIAGPEQRAAIWLALTAWFPLLLVVAYFRARATLPPSVVWIAFGYLDKQWVTSAYLLGVLAPMVLLVASARVLAAGRERPRSWRSWLSGLAPRRPDAVPPQGAPPAGAPAPRPPGPRPASSPRSRSPGTSTGRRGTSAAPARAARSASRRTSS